MPKKPITAFSFLFLILVLISAGCGSNAAQQIPSTATAPASTPIPPTETPKPAANKVWISLGDGLDQQDSQSITQQIQTLAQQAGLVVEQKSPVSKADLASQAEQVKLVVAFPPDPGLAEMAAASPQVLFISIGIPGLAEAANLYQVAPQGKHPEWDGYLAGYIAAILTDDYRIGMLTEGISADGTTAAAGFNDGGVMFCGLCNPVYPPYTDYPYVMTLPANPQQADWQPVADAFIAKAVKTAYVYPSVSSPELLLYLAQNGMKLIGSEPAPKGLEPVWIATIQTDYGTPFTAAWGDVLAGKTAAGYPVQLKVIPTDGNGLTEGKMKWIDQVISGLIDGTLMQ
jgi:hypothetical protein